MSEPVDMNLDCPGCGWKYGFGHAADCRIYPATPPPVYDLAEFELRLEGWVAGAKGCRNDSESALAVEIVLGLLKASKREAK